MKNIIGWIIVLFGVGLLLQATNISQFDSIANFFWPVIIMAVGVMAYRSNRRSPFGPIIIFLVGAMMFVDALNVWSRSAWELFWPIIVVLIGIRIAFGKFPGPNNVKQTSNTPNPSALFSGVEERSSGTYSGGSASAWFGGVKLDLRQATITDGAVLNVMAGFGGIDILVPKTVKVTTSVAPIFGGADNKANPDATATATLQVNGTALFGGVSIKN